MADIMMQEVVIKCCNLLHVLCLFLAHVGISVFLFISNVYFISVFLCQCVNSLYWFNGSRTGRYLTVIIVNRAVEQLTFLIAQLIILIAR